MMLAVCALGLLPYPSARTIIQYKPSSLFNHKATFYWD